MFVSIYRAPQFLRPRGLGETTTAAPGFVEGVTAWQSPSAAFAAISSPSGKPAAYLAGLALPVIGALLVAKNMLGKRR